MTEILHEDDSDSIDQLTAFVATSENRQLLCRLASGRWSQNELLTNCDCSTEVLDTLMSNLIQAGIVQRQPSNNGDVFTATDRLQVNRSGESVIIRVSNVRGEFVEVRFPTIDASRE